MIDDIKDNKWIKKYVSTASYYLDINAKDGGLSKDSRDLQMKKMRKKRKEKKEK